MGNQDEVQRKIFLSKEDPAAALAALKLLISHADEDEHDHPPRRDAIQVPVLGPTRRHADHVGPQASTPNP